MFDGLSTNFEALRDELARCRALPQRLDVNRALDLAARLLAPTSDSDHRRRELIVVSDFQRTTWAKADFSPLSNDTQIQLESTAPAEPLANLAILRVEGRSAGSQGNMLVEVEVGNYSPTARKVAVEVVLGGSRWQLSGTCPPGGRTSLSEQIGVRQSGWQSGEARLLGVDDALAADNVYPFTLHVRPQTSYVLMTRQPVRHKASSSLFLECALAPTEASRKSVLRVDPATFDRTTAAAGDVILLDHPGKLSDETVKLLAGLLQRGRPIVYVASELVDATNLKRLSAAAGSGLQMPVEFVPPPAGQIRRDLFLTSVRRDSPPFSVFGDDVTTMIGGLRFAGGLSSRRLETGMEAEVLATFNDGSAGIVLTSADAGGLAVINADLAASNLPKTAAFVPLLSELVTQMLQRRGATDLVYCGEPLVARLPTEAGSAAGLRVCGPDDAGGDARAGRYGELVDEAAGAVWRWAMPDKPGVYRVERGGATVFAAAVNLPAEESDLEDAARRRAHGAARRGPRGRVSRHGRRGRAPRRFLEMAGRGVRGVLRHRDSCPDRFPYVSL